MSPTSAAHHQRGERPHLRRRHQLLAYRIGLRFRLHRLLQFPLDLLEALPDFLPQQEYPLRARRQLHLGQPSPSRLRQQAGWRRDSPTAQQTPISFVSLVTQRLARTFARPSTRNSWVPSSGKSTTTPWRLPHAPRPAPSAGRRCDPSWPCDRDADPTSARGPRCATLTNTARSSRTPCPGQRSRLHHSGHEGPGSSANTFPNSSLGTRSRCTTSPVSAFHPHHNVLHLLCTSNPMYNIFACPPFRG